MLNSEESFDLTFEHFSNSYTPIDIIEKSKYVNQYMSTQKFDYEDEVVEYEDIEKLIPLAYQRFERKRKETNFKSKCRVLISIPNNKYVVIL